MGRSQAMVGPLLALVLVSVGGAATASTPPTRRARSPVALEFRPVIAPMPSVAATPPTSAPVNLAGAKRAIASCDDAAVAQLAVIPTTTAAAATADACVVYPDRTGGREATRYYLGPAAVTRRGINNAKPDFVSGQGWTVTLTLTRSGSKAWDALARAQFHKQVALTVAGRVVAAPTIQPADATFRSFGGTAVIASDFTHKEVVALTEAVGH